MVSRIQLRERQVEGVLIGIPVVRDRVAAEAYTPTWMNAGPASAPSVG